MARERLTGLNRRAAGRVSVVSTALLLAVLLFPSAGLALTPDPPLIPPAETDQGTPPDVKSATVDIPDTDQGTPPDVKSATVDLPETEPVAPPGLFYAFPVQGDFAYKDTFGASRPGGRTHTGIDIIADRMTPVVAVASGVVITAEVSDGLSGTFVRIQHEDGSISSYIHLNNDTPGTDDGLGVGIAEGIEVGVHVEAGTVIGYVGDSGNAEETVPHLHFAYSQDGENAMNPFAELKLSEGIVVANVGTETLPFTGAGSAGLVLLAVFLVGAGAGVLSINRRAGDGTQPVRVAQGQGAPE